MKLPVNWVTTLGGLLAGIPALIKGSGLACLPEPQAFCAPDTILGFIGGLGILIIGLGAKDSNVTGGTKDNRKVGG